VKKIGWARFFPPTTPVPELLPVIVDQLKAGAIDRYRALNRLQSGGRIRFIEIAFAT
jgi:hypothetical protein